ncbi:MAG: hypothetical protein ACK4N6_05775, partial [Rhodocyclaceae bacterium]
ERLTFMVGSPLRLKPAGQWAFASRCRQPQAQAAGWPPTHPDGKPDFHHPAGFTLALDRTA